MITSCISLRSFLDLFHVGSSLLYNLDPVSDNEFGVEIKRPTLHCPPIDRAAIFCFYNNVGLRISWGFVLKGRGLVPAQSGRPQGCAPTNCAGPMKSQRANNACTHMIPLFKQCVEWLTFQHLLTQLNDFFIRYFFLHTIPLPMRKTRIGCWRSQGKKTAV